MEIILIVGHGSKKKETTGIERVEELLHNIIHPECKKKCVRVAYLQFGEPAIMEAIKNSVQNGAKKIIINPYFLHRGVHVTKNIPEVIKEAKNLYPNIEFIYTEPLGAHEKIAEVVLERIKAVTDLKDNS